MVEKERPLGITIIAIWTILGGLLGLLYVLVIPYFYPNYMPYDQLPSSLQAKLYIGLAMSIIGLIIAYGLLKGRFWAWTIAIIFLVIGIATEFIYGLNVFRIIINIIVIYYLTRPHIKEYFYSD